jgi:hypothetical protein
MIAVDDAVLHVVAQGVKALQRYLFQNDRSDSKQNLVSSRQFITHNTTHLLKAPFCGLTNKGNTVRCFHKTATIFQAHELATNIFMKPFLLSAVNAN